MARRDNSINKKGNGKTMIVKGNGSGGEIMMDEMRIETIEKMIKVKGREDREKESVRENGGKK